MCQLIGDLIYPLQDQKCRRLKRRVQKIILLVVFVELTLLCLNNHCYMGDRKNRYQPAFDLIFVSSSVD